MTSTVVPIRFRRIVLPRYRGMVYKPVDRVVGLRRFDEKRLGICLHHEDDNRPQVGLPARGHFPHDVLSEALLRTEGGSRWLEPTEPFHLERKTYVVILLDVIRQCGETVRFGGLPMCICRHGKANLGQICPLCQRRMTSWEVLKQPTVIRHTCPLAKGQIIGHENRKRYGQEPRWVWRHQVQLVILPPDGGFTLHLWRRQEQKIGRALAFTWDGHEHDFLYDGTQEGPSNGSFFISNDTVLTLLERIVAR